MLPKHIDGLLRERIGTDLLVKGKKQRDVVQTALAKSFQSGFHPARLSAIAQLDEIGNRGKIISDAMIDVLDRVKVSPYPSLIEDLVRLYELHFVETVTEWKSRVTEALRTSGTTDHREIDEKIETWRREYCMEVKLRGAAIMEPVLRGNVISISVENSNVGAIQTGDHSVVGTGIRMTKEESAELVKVLGDLVAMLMANPVPDANQQKDLREAILEAQAEAKKPTPNWVKLKGLLSMIWAIIKDHEKLRECGTWLLSILHKLGITFFS